MPYHIFSYSHLLKLIVPVIFSLTSVFTACLGGLLLLQTMEGEDESWLNKSKKNVF